MITDIKIKSHGHNLPGQISRCRVCYQPVTRLLMPHQPDGGVWWHERSGLIEGISGGPHVARPTE